MVLLSLSRWLRKKAAWRRFWTNAAVFFVLQARARACMGRGGTWCAKFVEHPASVG
jgi:hypothetical protein